SAGSAIFQAWLLQLTPALVADTLGPLVTADYRAFERLSFVSRFLANTLQSPGNSWCNQAAPGAKSCDDVVSDALHAAVTDLSQRLGANPTAWRRDAVHRTVFRHQL